MDDLYIKKVMAGDAEAFRYFIRQYQHMAYTIAFSVVKDAFVAEDIVQEAFVLAYNKLASFKGSSKFSTWFYRIVINLALRRHEKEKKWRHETIESQELPDISTGLEEMTQEERRYFINEALNVLPANESLALRLFYLNEYSLEEIRDLTGWSVTNSKVILHRARKHFYCELKKQLNSEVKHLL